MKTFAVVASGIVVSVIVVFCIIIGVLNSEIELRNSVKAHLKTNEASFDTMWKIIQQKAGVTDKYKSDFKEVWSDIIRGRYIQGSGQLMNWIQEKNPEFDSSIYKDLMGSVEAERKRFLRDQESLVRINNQRDNIIDKPLTRFVLSTFGGIEAITKIEIKLVTSEKTDKAFESGQENDVDLFKKT